MRVLRHPSILRFIELVKTSAGHLIVTEEVQPLALVIKKLTALEIVAGLCEICHALAFLHDAVSIENNYYKPCYLKHISYGILYFSKYSLVY